MNQKSKDALAIWLHERNKRKALREEMERRCAVQKANDEHLDRIISDALKHPYNTSI